MQKQFGAFLIMRCLNKLLVPLAFSMLFSSGVTSAKDMPYEKVYECMPDSLRAFILQLPESQRYDKTREGALYINFMKDGGFIVETELGKGRATTYGLSLYKQSYLRNASASSLQYKDLGGHHKFVIDDYNPVSLEGSIYTFVLDKDVMNGTSSSQRTRNGSPLEYEGVVEGVKKEGMGCTQVYPSV